MKKALIVGFGHVGQSTLKYLKNLDIWYMDKDYIPTNGKEQLEVKDVKADYWIICVPGEKD